jgi:hypothetical protein
LSNHDPEFDLRRPILLRSTMLERPIVRGQIVA